MPLALPVPFGVPVGRGGRGRTTSTWMCGVDGAPVVRTTATPLASVLRDVPHAEMPHAPRSPRSGRLEVATGVSPWRAAKEFVSARAAGDRELLAAKPVAPCGGFGWPARTSHGLTPVANVCRPLRGLFAVCRSQVAASRGTTWRSDAWVRHHCSSCTGKAGGTRRPGVVVPGRLAGSWHTRLARALRWLARGPGAPRRRGAAGLALVSRRDAATWGSFRRHGAASAPAADDRESQPTRGDDVTRLVFCARSRAAQPLFGRRDAGSRLAEIAYRVATQPVALNGWPQRDLGPCDRYGTFRYRYGRLCDRYGTLRTATFALTAFSVRTPVLHRRPAVRCATAG